MSYRKINTKLIYFQPTFNRTLTHCARPKSGEKGEPQTDDKRRNKTNQFLAHYLFWLLVLSATKSKNVQTLHYERIEAATAAEGHRCGISGSSSESLQRSLGSSWVFSRQTAASNTSRRVAESTEALPKKKKTSFTSEIADLTRCSAIKGLW